MQPSALTPQPKTPCPAVLYVEDEQTDILLLRLAFQRAGLTNPLHTTVDGVEAIDYLTGNGHFANRVQYPLPALVLVDLNLPRKSGFEVLQWARRQPRFAALPIVVYTSSLADVDRHKARALGATDYIVKPSDVKQMADLARTLAERWLT